MAEHRDRKNPNRSPNRAVDDSRTRHEWQGWIDAFAFQIHAGLDVGLLDRPAHVRERERQTISLPQEKSPGRSYDRGQGKTAHSTPEPRISADRSKEERGARSLEQPTDKHSGSNKGPLPLRIGGMRGKTKKEAPEAKALHAAQAAENLADLEAAIRNFEGCPLKDTATHTVFSRGSTDARILLLGEAPGAEEDRQGKPFVGRSGKLLDQMLAAVGFGEDHVLISNAVYWRPPGNRNPTQRELTTCRPFVERLISLQRPAFVVLLGAQAAKSLLGEETLKSAGGIGRLRKTSHSLTPAGCQEPTPIVATFHPAYLLRQPGQKRQAWADWLRFRNLFEQSD